MADDQLEWVFDSLVEFLRGPIWNIPVLTFIEQKSVVFEPGAENEEELKKIHEAYKNLVDFMLGSYMEDLKISPEEFERSCSVASKKALNQFHQNLFQQVWAADDFEIFKRMMTQKNLELQLQALEFLTQKRGSVPDCMEPAGRIKEENEMEEIIKKAIIETEPHLESITPADAVLQDKMNQVAEKEKQLLEQAMKQSVRENITENCPGNALVESEKEIEEPQVTEDAKSVDNIQDDDYRNEPEGSDEKVVDMIQINEQISDVDSPEEQLNDVDQCTKKVLDINIEESTTKISSAEALPPLKAIDERPWSEGDSSVYTQVQVEVSPLELEKRQNYLRQQRDRILALKKQERARRLSISEEVITQARPKSARAARKILREESTEVDPQTLAFRKTLAAKLRHEVVDKAD